MAASWSLQKQSAVDALTQLLTPAPPAAGATPDSSARVNRRHQDKVKVPVALCSAQEGQKGDAGPAHGAVHPSQGDAGFFTDLLAEPRLKRMWPCRQTGLPTDAFARADPASRTVLAACPVAVPLAAHGAVRGHADWLAPAPGAQVQPLARQLSLEQQSQGGSCWRHRRWLQKWGSECTDLSPFTLSLSPRVQMHQLL